MYQQAKFAAVLAAVCAMTACGGGGGGGSNGISYTGKTTPAAITASNGDTVAAESYNGGKVGTAISFSVQNGPAPGGGRSRLLSIYKALDTGLQKLDPGASRQNNPMIAAQVNVSDTVAGTCATSPGNYSYSISMDDTTGDFSGSVTFNKYCDLGETLNGSTTFSGKYNQTAGGFDNFTINFTELNDATATDSSTLSGSLVIDNTKNPLQATMNVLLRDEHTGDVFKAENFVITDAVAIDGSYDDVTMSGRFYIPTEGYVDLSTPQAMHILAADVWPSSGSVKVIGANNASATLTALSNVSYRVDVDDNGDGTADSTTTGNWADL